MYTIKFLYGTVKTFDVLKGANLSEADLSEADLNGANLIGADLSGANLIGADLSGADLRRADLSKADLSEADLNGANLIGANLIGADLSGADLRGTNLCSTKLISFTCGRHMGWIHVGKQYPEGNWCQIGCEGHSLQHWLENYKDIGKSHMYEEKAIQAYGVMIEAWAEVLL